MSHFTGAICCKRRTAFHSDSTRKSLLCSKTFPKLLCFYVFAAGFFCNPLLDQLFTALAVHDNPRDSSPLTPCSASRCTELRHRVLCQEPDRNVSAKDINQKLLSFAKEKIAKPVKYWLYYVQFPSAAVHNTYVTNWFRTRKNLLHLAYMSWFTGC